MTRLEQDRPGTASRLRFLAGSASAAVVVGLLALPAVGAAQPTMAMPGTAVSASHLRATGSVIVGRVEIAGRPVRNSQVRLHLAGKRTGHAKRIDLTRTDDQGRFRVQVPAQVLASRSLYLTARHGKLGQVRVPRTVVLASALAGRRHGRVTVNELTTAAAGYSLAQFTTGQSVGGREPGLSNAMWMPRNLVNVRTGKTTKFLRTRPNGSKTQTLASVNSLASIITGCAQQQNRCGSFLKAATDAWGTRPQNTWQAMAMLPRNPSGDPGGVYAQIPARPKFTPVLSGAPTAWVLALIFVGNGRQFNGPGNVALDTEGKVWANNNAEWAVKLKNVCAGQELFKLDPYSPGRPLDVYTGGGLNGAGFGIGIDPKNHIWVANFGFSGTKCPTPPTANSVSEFSPDGTPISRKKGYRQGPLSWPQGIKSAPDGDIWIANCGNDKVVRYRNGNPLRSQVVSSEVTKAFDVAFNTDGNAFVTANGGNKVYGFDPSGHALPGSPYGDSSMFALPLGIASDRLGNTWVSNSGIIPSPCHAGDSLDAPPLHAKLNGSIVRVGPDGSLKKFTGAGLTVPWGIAVDGDDNIWVANFSGQRLSHLCGDRASTCPPGTEKHRISTSAGYSFDGLQRNTGVQIDPSGNVWLTNNWKKYPVQVNPFGNGLVAYLGMAAPVRTPLIGTPQPL